MKSKKFKFKNQSQKALMEFESSCDELHQAGLDAKRVYAKWNRDVNALAGVPSELKQLLLDIDQLFEAESHENIAVAKVLDALRNPLIRPVSIDFDPDSFTVNARAGGMQSGYRFKAHPEKEDQNSSGVQTGNEGRNVQ
jgi:hypothetical protein